MTEKIKELLSVLDLPEYEQITWLASEGVAKLMGEVGKMVLVVSLADLAFRLRDEIKEPEDFLSALYTVTQYLKVKYTETFWGLFYAKPIDWIITALIAKELCKVH